MVLRFVLFRKPSELAHGHYRLRAPARWHCSRMGSYLWILVVLKRKRGAKCPRWQAPARRFRLRVGALMAFIADRACRQSAAASVGREACRGRGRRSYEDDDRERDHGSTAEDGQ